MMNKVLLILFLISLVCIIFINFIWGNTPEFWKLGEEVGVVMNGLSMSFVAAYIFYLLDIFIPKRKKEKLINARIVEPGILIVRDIENLFEDLILLAERKIVFLNNTTLSEEELLNILNAIKIVEDRIPFKLDNSLKELTVFDSMLLLKKRIDKFSNQITSFQEIDLKLFISVKNIENASLWALIINLEKTLKLKPEIKNAIEGALFLECLCELQSNKEDLKAILLKKIDISKKVYEAALVEDERINELRKKLNIYK